MLQIATGTFSSGTSTGLRFVTGIGFQPELLLVHGGRAQGVTYTSGGVVHWIGGAVSAGNRFAICSSVQGGANTSEKSAHSSSRIVYALDATGTLEWRADLASLDADGFTLNIQTAPPAGRTGAYIALAGLAAVNIVECQAPTSTGQVAYTGMGFRPDALIQTSANNASDPATSPIGTNSRGSTGLGTASAQGAAGWFGLQGATADTSRWQTPFDFVLHPSNGEGKTEEAALVSLDADGFTLDWQTVAGGGRYFWAIGLKGVRAKMGTYTQPTAPGSFAITTGFQPRGLVLMGSDQAAALSPQPTMAHSLGCYDGSVNTSSQMVNRDGTNPKSAGHGGSAVHCHRALTATANSTSVVAEGSGVSLDANGFTLNYSLVDAIARQVLYLALAERGAIPPHFFAAPIGI